MEQLLIKQGGRISPAGFLEKVLANIEMIDMPVKELDDFLTKLCFLK